MTHLRQLDLSSKGIRLLACLLIVSAVGAAQTTVPPNMLRKWGGGTLDELRLFAVAVDGVAQVRLGPGLRLEERGGALLLSASAGPACIVAQILTQDENGNYVCPRCQAVFRNGIRLFAGLDYGTNFDGILPRGGVKKEPWARADLVVGEWIGTEGCTSPAPVAGMLKGLNDTSADAIAQAEALARERATVVPADMIQNWKQVAPNELLAATDPRRRPGVALSQIETPPACAWWYGQRIKYATALGKAPPLVIDCSGDGLAAFWQGAGGLSTGTGPAVTDPAGGDRARVGR